MIKTGAGDHRDMYPGLRRSWQRLRTAGRTRTWPRATKRAAIGGAGAVILRSGGRNPATLIKAGENAGRGRPEKEAAATLERLESISIPMDEECTAGWAICSWQKPTPKGAVREYPAVVAAKPLDPAASHFNLARALKAQNESTMRRSNCCSHSKPRPDYKPAQKTVARISH